MVPLRNNVVKCIKNVYEFLQVFVLGVEDSISPRKVFSMTNVCVCVCYLHICSQISNAMFVSKDTAGERDFVSNMLSLSLSFAHTDISDIH